MARPNPRRCASLGAASQSPPADAFVEGCHPQESGDPVSFPPPNQRSAPRACCGVPRAATSGGGRADSSVGGPAPQGPQSCAPPACSTAHRSRWPARNSRGPRAPAADGSGVEGPRSAPVAQGTARRPEATDPQRARGARDCPPAGSRRPAARPWRMGLREPQRPRSKRLSRRRSSRHPRPTSTQRPRIAAYAAGSFPP